MTCRFKILGIRKGSDNIVSNKGMREEKKRREKSPIVPMAPCVVDLFNGNRSYTARSSHCVNCKRKTKTIRLVFMIRKDNIIVRQYNNKRNTSDTRNHFIVVDINHCRVRFIYIICGTRIARTLQNEKTFAFYLRDFVWSIFCVNFKRPLRFFFFFFLNISKLYYFVMNKITRMTVPTNKAY